MSIIKVNGFKVVSHKKRKGGKRRSFGTYPSRIQAERRLEQIQRFKHMKKR